MNNIEELSRRLRADVLKNYDVRHPNPRFDEATKTLHFLVRTYLYRSMNTVEVPVRLMQHICSLGADGFEAASGYRHPNQKEALADLLDKLWYNFTGTLMRWVEKQRKNGSIPQELWYSCFRVPVWFIQAVQKDIERRSALD